jgi:hypothetical protein
VYLIAEVVRMILKECTFTTAEVDDVILKQGELGDWLVASDSCNLHFSSSYCQRNARQSLE